MCSIITLIYAWRPAWVRALVFHMCISTCAVDTAHAKINHNEGMDALTCCHAVTSIIFFLLFFSLAVSQDAALQRAAWCFTLVFRLGSRCVICFTACRDVTTCTFLLYFCLYSCECGGRSWRDKGRDGGKEEEQTLTYEWKVEKRRGVRSGRGRLRRIQSPMLRLLKSWDGKYFEFSGT